jgi:heme exporter protein A
MTAAEDHDSAPLLRVEALACVRGGRRVLQGVSLVLAPGSVLLLTGPNGSGKTSLLRCLAGLLPISGGTVAGSALGAAGLIHVGHADPAKPHLTVRENLRWWTQLDGVAANGLDAAIEAAGLARLAATPVAILSAGQRRRLSLARLRTTPAALWLLDEPANALDTDAVARLVAALDQHRARGGGALIATHDTAPFADAARLDLSPGGAA